MAPIMQAVKKLVIVAILIAIPLVGHTASYPTPTGFVNDFANIIDSGTRIQLTNITRKFEKATSN